MNDPRAQAVAAYRAVRAHQPDFAPHATEVLERIETLGEGGMGVVHRVIDHRLGRQAALKLVLDPDGAGPDTVARFRREARITARLDHPSIPPVYEGGTTPTGQPFMLMKVIEGQPLKDVIADAVARDALRSRRTELLEVLVKVGEAVAYAHEQQVLHRDLKPANVMVGRFGEVLVLDWGLARELGKPDDLEPAPPSASTVPGTAAPATPLPDGIDPALTQAGAVMGTPGWMPPEQAGGEELDERADVFALGALLTAVLTGKGPIQGATVTNLIVATLTGKIAAPRDRRRDVPRDLDAIARAALTPDPDRRTPSAAAFVADLRAWLAGRQVACYRYGPLEQLLRLARRRPGLVVGLVGFVAALGVVLGLVRELQVRAERTEQERAAAGEKLERTQVEAKLREQAAAAEQERAAEAQRVATSAREAIAALHAAEAHVRAGGDLLSVRAGIDKALTDLPTPETFRHACVIAIAAQEWPTFRELSDRWMERLRPGIDGIQFRHDMEYDLARAAGKPPHEATRRWEELLAERAGSTRDPRARRALTYLTALQRFRTGEIAAAAKILDELLTAAPNHGGALALRAACSLKRRDWRAMVRDSERATRVASHRPEPHYYLGYALDELGLFQEAINAYTLCVTLLPTHFESVTNRANTRIKLGDYRSAIADCDHVLKHRPDDYAALNLRGIARRKLADYEGAIADHRRNLELRPDDPGSLANLANVYSATGDQRRALATFDRLARLLPNDWRPHASRAAVLSKLKRIDEAVAAIDRAIALAGTTPFPSWNKALILCGAGRLDAALQAADRALQLAPHDRRARVARGRVHLKAGRLPPALADFDAALNVDANDPAALGWRGVTLSRQGKRAEALRLLRRAVARISPEHPDRRELFEALLKLEAN